MFLWIKFKKGPGAGSQGNSPCLNQECKMNRKEIPAWVTYVLLALAIAMCAFGVIRGEWKDVMRKAVAICMECIGIG